MENENVGRLGKKFLEGCNKGSICSAVRAPGIADDSAQSCDGQPVDGYASAVEIVPIPCGRPYRMQFIAKHIVVPGYPQDPTKLSAEGFPNSSDVA